MPTLPVDVMIGFFRQSLDVGTLIETDANSLFVAASKSWPRVTLYGGYAREDSEMSHRLHLRRRRTECGLHRRRHPGEPADRRRHAERLAKLNVEMAHGDLTTYTAGLMFGF